MLTRLKVSTPNIVIVCRIMEKKFLIPALQIGGSIITLHDCEMLEGTILSLRVSSHDLANSRK